jgi:hypothetical protein
MRPVPLHHYIYPAGADGLHLVVDDTVVSFLFVFIYFLCFNRENFVKIISVLLWRHYEMWVMQQKVINEDEEVALKVMIYSKSME